MITTLLLLGTSQSIHANWSGSKELNDSERVQIIEDNIYKPNNE